jgi:peptidyl-prolyl cis-trans isomerase C/peptidyl-prolyl cis-trans isomerase D
MFIKNVLFFFVFLIATHFAQAQVVAKVGKNEITLKSFKERYEDMKKNVTGIPPTPKEFLADLIRFEIGVQEAEKRKMNNDPIVQERFRQELYKALLDKELGKNVESIKITDAELRDYYKKNPEIRFSHILIQYKPDATESEKKIASKRADEIFAEVKASKRPFEELVKLYSDDTVGKTTGGDVGFQGRFTLTPEIYATLYKAKINDIIGPISSTQGYHIVKITAHREFKDADQVQIRKLVFDVKRKELFDSYFQKLSKQYPVTKNENLIKSMK